MTRMKKQNLAGLLVGLCLCAAPLVGEAQVKIMPFGDSVTSRGSDPESSYRYWLWQDLINAGFSVDFIGQSSGVSDGGTPAHTDFDQDYEGGDGLTSSDALNMAPAAASFDGGPDIVLLDFGSNDISPAGIPLDQTINNLDQIIHIFAAQNPNVIILIAKPTPFAPDPSSSKQDQKLQKREQSQLAGMVGKLAKTEKKAGINVIAVGQFGGFNVKKDTQDGSHPNVIGEQKIATRYFKVLKKQLKNFN
jgi:lysophospholipase L1-like esterase